MQKDMEKEKGKENNGRNVTGTATPSSSRKMLKASAFQPHAGVMARAKKSAAASEEKDPMSALLNAIKDKGTRKSILSPDQSQNTHTKKGFKVSPPQRSASVAVRPKRPNTAPVQGDPMNALLNSIKECGSQQKKQYSPGPSPKEALQASIRNRRESLPLKPAPDGVNDRIKHINDNTVRKESRVLMVNRMLKEAPSSVRQGKNLNRFVSLLEYLVMNIILNGSSFYRPQTS